MRRVAARLTIVLAFPRTDKDRVRSVNIVIYISDWSAHHVPPTHIENHLEESEGKFWSTGGESNPLIKICSQAPKTILASRAYWRPPEENRTPSYSGCSRVLSHLATGPFLARLIGLEPTFAAPLQLPPSQGGLTTDA